MGSHRKLLIVCIIILNIFTSCAQEILVDVNQGTVRGTIKIDRKGNQFYSFQSIPYAAKPIGELRFRDPQPAESWDGVLDASQDLPECFQVLYNGTTFGQEDCLYLNVYTPELPTEGTELKPVLVFIHGGGFLEGSGRQDYYSPEFLIPEDVLVVTFNYRLNIFGFFNLENTSLGTPGNAGLKDQLQALEWVRDNVQYFGGDPSRVTLFGQSAGGASVHLHVLSPRSRGLFSKVIVQSGVASSPWMLGYHNNGRLIAEAWGIPTDDEEAMLNVLRSMTTEEIFLGFQGAALNNPMRWGGIQQPIIESQTDGSAFFVDDPLTLIRSGDYSHVPMMVGYTDAEGIYFDQYIRNLTGGISVPITDFFTVVPWDLNVTAGSAEAEQLMQEIKEFYHGDNEPTPDDMQPFIEIYRDVWFGFPSRRAVLEHVKTNEGNPIYLYRFTADTQMNVYKRRDEISSSYPGASHCDELGYLFKTFITPDVEDGSVEDVAIDRIVRIWTNFAKFSEPLPDDDGVVWTPVQEDTANYLDIGSEQLVAGVNPDYESMNFWLDIYDRFY